MTCKCFFSIFNPAPVAASEPTDSLLVRQML